MLEEIEAAGLLDPSAPDAEYRTVIAQQLLDVGLSVADVIAILEAEDVEHAMNSRLLFPGPRLEITEFAARVGVSVEQIKQISFAAGLAPSGAGDGARIFSASDEAVFAAFNAGVALFGETPPSSALPATPASRRHRSNKRIPPAGTLLAHL